MQIELIEIRDHLSRFPPFDELPEELLDDIARQVDIAYFKAGTDILTFNQEIHELHYIRSGAVDIFRRSGDLYNRLGEGDIFGHFGLLRRNRVRFPARAIEDTLIYYIPGTLFDQLCEQHEHFADFVEAEGQSRLKAAVENGRASELMKIKVRKLISRLPVTAPLTTSVQEAAQIMTSQSVSSLVVVDPHSHWPNPDRVPVADAQHGVMVGIITDRASMIDAVADAGFEIPRTSKNYITAKDPDTGERWRLKGEIFHEDWQADPAKREAERRAGHDQAGLRRLDGIPVGELQDRFDGYCERRAAYHRERYAPLPEREQELVRDVDRTDQALADDLALGDLRADRDGDRLDDGRELALDSVTDALGDGGAGPDADRPGGNRPG